VDHGTGENGLLNRQCWKNPVTGSLHFQVHPCGAKELHVDPLPSGSSREGALYPDGGVVTDLKEVRETLYKMQRPGISPQYVYAQDWKEGDLVLFHNRGLLHSVVGAFTPDQLRMFHQVSTTREKSVKEDADSSQCNLAASEDPVGPNEEDVHKYA
jgi:alpha-ketoglutarate-dependent taurine dioxygenase